MLSREEIVTFRDEEPPPGASPWVAGARPDTDVNLVEYDATWADDFDAVAQVVRRALGSRVLHLEHVGSTAVPGLAAKPIIDVDLLVADPDDEDSYLPPLESVGFVLRIREPWWNRHRLLRYHAPRSNLHVFGPESPEPVRHRLFRDWLRAHPDDRALYAAIKAEAAAGATDVMDYNRRKEAVVREIYGRAFTLLDRGGQMRRPRR